MTNLRWIGFGLAISFLSGPTGPLRAQESSAVAWLDEAHSRVLFVPASLLNSLRWGTAETPSLEGTGMSEFDREVLSTTIEWFRGQGKMTLEEILAGSCSYPSVEDSSSGAGPGAGSKETKPLVDWLRLGGRAYIATVRSIEPGWSPSSMSVASRVTLEFSSPIVGARLKASSTLVTRVEPSGWMTLGSVTLCRPSSSTLATRSVGDRVFVWEDRPEEASYIPRMALILPVDDDGIDVGSCSICGGGSRVEVEALRRALGAQ